MSELKLLNCPFCGGEARLYGNSKPIGARLKHYQVAVCTNDDCGCRTSPCETVEDAIYKWNTRTPMDNIVENIEKHLEEDSHNEYSSYYRGNYQMISAYDAINIVKQEMGVMNNEPTNN